MPSRGGASNGQLSQVQGLEWEEPAWVELPKRDKENVFWVG